MEKTNVEIRRNLYHKYSDEFRKLNQAIELLAESWYSKEEINTTRERLIKNLESKLSGEEWYKESKKSHRAEHKAKKQFKKAQEVYNNSRQIYNNAQINYMWKVVDLKEELFWDKIAILYFLKKNVKVEENIKMMWFKWKKVHINLPAVWKFKWFQFEYFVSNCSVNRDDFKKNPQLKKKSYTMQDVWGLLRAMNKYMQSMGVKTDWDMNYEKDLESRKTHNYRCYAWDYLIYISGLDWKKYWIKNKIITRRGTLYAVWDCDYWCRFDIPETDYNCYLLLRLSD